MPAKYSGPDLLQSVMYLIHDNSTFTISLDSIASCTILSNSLIYINYFNTVLDFKY